MPWGCIDEADQHGNEKRWKQKVQRCLAPMVDIGVLLALHHITLPCGQIRWGSAILIKQGISPLSGTMYALQQDGVCKILDGWCIHEVTIMLTGYWRAMFFMLAENRARGRGRFDHRRSRARGRGRQVIRCSTHVDVAIVLQIQMA